MAAECAQGCGAEREIRRLQSDAVLLDVQLPDINGFDLEERMRGVVASRFIMTSAREATFYRNRLSRRGAPAFVAKHDLCATSLRPLLEAA